MLVTPVLSPGAWRRDPPLSLSDRLNLSPCGILASQNKMSDAQSHRVCSIRDLSEVLGEQKILPAFSQLVLVDAESAYRIARAANETG